MCYRSAGPRHAATRDSGFTLVEMMVVVIILGTLAAIAFPILRDQRTKADQATLLADIKQARTLMQGYQFENTGSLGSACYTHTACHAAGGPGHFLANTLDMKFSPGNRVGDFWGGGGGGAASTFHLCIEHVEGTTTTGYSSIDTAGHGNWAETGKGGCPWIGVGAREPQPAP